MSQNPEHLEDRKIDGVRQFSPTSARNKGPICDTLKPALMSVKTVLEIASGSGEHGLHMTQTIPHLTWQYSDPFAPARASQDDWRRENPAHLLPSLPLDTTQPEWWGGLPRYDALYCANMIHIAPWSAALGLAKGAAQILGEGGQVFLYGPFLEGAKTAASNLAFDGRLKARDPAWGVRNLSSVKHIFADAGFNMRGRVDMPAENRLLTFTKTL